jgi:CBS domain-containing protein
MKLQNIAIPSGVAQSGMTVRDVFRECVRCQVPGIPFRDAEGRIVGRVSIRHTLRQSCIPDFMAQHAHLLGDEYDVECLNMPERRSRAVLRMPVDPFVLDQLPSITSHSPVLKALALMEEFDTGYIFVIDDDEYKGVVTLLGIARRMLEIDP